MKALIPAAGLGTRFLPATKCVPKELLPVINKPVIQYVVEEALAPAGVDEVIIINSHQKPQIEQFFASDEPLVRHLEEHGKSDLAVKVREVADLPVSFCYQDEPKGLGHAVLQAAEAVGDNPFFVLLGDYFVPDKAMCVAMQAVSRAHRDASVIAVAPVPHDQVSRYGIVAGDLIESVVQNDQNAQDTQSVQNDQNAQNVQTTQSVQNDQNVQVKKDCPALETPGAVLKLSGLVEKPSPEEAPTNLCIVGRYLLSPRVMELLKTQTPGAGGEIQLTDALERLLEEEDMYAVVVDAKTGYDTGTPAAWAAVNARMTLSDPKLKNAFLEEFGETNI